MRFLFTFVYLCCSVLFSPFLYVLDLTKSVFNFSFDLLAYICITYHTLLFGGGDPLVLPI